MAHPFVEHRAHRHEKARVGHIAHGGLAGLLRATGGVVMENETAKPVQRKAIKMRDAQAVEGSGVKVRADRPNRKKGGAVHGKHKGVTVNVIAAPHGGAGGPMPPMVPAPGAGPAPAMAGPPRPPMMPPPGAGGPPGMPPGMPPRRNGGAAYAKGGAVKDGPAWKEGRRAGTPVQNNPAGKNDQLDVGRKRVITYRTGGAVEHQAGSKPTTPHLPGGSGGGLARLRKEQLAKRATNGMAP